MTMVVMMMMMTMMVMMMMMEMVVMMRVQSKNVFATPVWIKEVTSGKHGRRPDIMQKDTRNHARVLCRSTPRAETHRPVPVQCS